MIRCFVLQRDRDVSGVSGIGVVAEGCQLPSGRIVLEWLGSVPSIVIYESPEQVEEVHGHGGATRVIWDD
jgi:hypothetical protein